MNKHLLFVLFLVSILSCKKDRDTTSPTLSFQEPGINSVHQVLNPLNFTVTASDETRLEKITVQLLNDSYLIVATSAILFCDENTEVFESSILPDDIHLPSGTYYLKAIASDGFNEKIAYREIQLQEVPRALRKIWVVSSDNNQIQLDSISGSTLSNGYSLNQDYGGFAINSYHQIMTVAGGITDDLIVLNAEYPSIKFSWINTNISSEPFFRHLKVENDKTFVSDRDGKIRSFRKNSAANDVVDLGNYYSESFCILNDFIISASVLSTGLQRSIQVYYLSTSTLSQGIISSTIVKKMFVKNSDEIILFGNESSIGKIKTYSVNNNNLTEPIIFSGGEIYDVCETSNGIYLIAYSDGVKIYDSNLNTLNDLVTGTSFHLIRFEDISEVIYAAHGNSVTSYSISPLTLIQNYSTTDSIVGLDILYNK